MAIDARRTLAYPSGVMSEISIHSTSFVPHVVPIQGQGQGMDAFVCTQSKRVWWTRRRPTD